MGCVENITKNTNVLYGQPHLYGSRYSNIMIIKSNSIRILLCAHHRTHISRLLILSLFFFLLVFTFFVEYFSFKANLYFFDLGGAIRALMMGIHAYFNIWCEARAGWAVFMKRRTAVHKISSLPEANEHQLRTLDDVCAICYQVNKKKYSLTKFGEFYLNLWIIRCRK